MDLVNRLSISIHTWTQRPPSGVEGYLWIPTIRSAPPPTCPVLRFKKNTKVSVQFKNFAHNRKTIIILY